MLGLPKLQGASVKSFLRAIFIGTLVGAGPPSLVTVPIGITMLINPIGSDYLSPALTAFFPLAAAFALVLSSSVLIGLPVAMLLRRIKQHKPSVITIIGGLAGVLVPFVIILLLFPDQNPAVFSLLGLMSGSATARTWAVSQSARQ